MLRLILGRSGSGKTYAVMERLAALAAAGETGVLLLVPEQHSFVSERMLLRRLGPAGAARVAVLSFTRLAQTVFREVGGLAGEPLDEGARALLMSRALAEVAAVSADRGETLLGAAPRQLRDAGYVKQLLSLLEELRQCGVPAAELERMEQSLAAEGTLTDEPLRNKMRDLYKVYTAYEGLVAAAGQDELTVLDRLADKLPDSQLPTGAHIFVDGFKGFTVQELTVLERLLPRAAEVTVTLTADTSGRDAGAVEYSREMPLFQPVVRTAQRLRRLAEDLGVICETELLTENRRTADPALRALEAGLYAPDPTAYEPETSAVTLIPCADVYEECRWAARTVRRLLREGLRAREITVVARDLAPYRGLLGDALAQAGVPYTMDERQELMSEPLLVYVRTALRLAVGGWRTEELLRLLKTDLGPLNPIEIARLENYAYTWRVEGVAWEQPFTEHPDGMGAVMTPAAARRLAQLNQWRQMLIEPLARLRQALRGEVTGREFAGALYAYLTADTGLPDRIAAQAARLEELAEPLLAEHAGRLWDELMGMLDRFALTLPEHAMSAARAEELFTMLAGLLDLGRIPQGLDAVTVGAADRIRYTQPRAVVLLGANEGVFPAYPAEDGLLTEAERQALRQRGMTLADDRLSQCIEERYYAYMALVAATEQVYISYWTGPEDAPSPLVRMTESLLPHCRREPAQREDGADLETAEELFRRLALDYTHSTPVTESLRQTMAALPEYAGRLAAVARGAGETAFRLEDTVAARALFHTEQVLSASQIEQYHQCPFAYFCRYGLHVKPRTVAQIDAVSFGSLVHYVMETVLPTYVGEGNWIEQLRAEVAARAGQPPEEIAAAETAIQQQLLFRLEKDVHRAVETYLAEQLGGQERKSARFLYQLRLAERAAGNMLWHTVMELRQSAFIPRDYELNILPAESADGNGVLSVRLPFDGGGVQLVGKVDRVDLYVRFDGTAFVRVVDYKTGTKKFDLGEVPAGLNMQMLLYLYVLCDNSRRYLEESGELRPAGVLYHPLSDMLTDPDGTVTDRLKTMTMSGLVLDDAAVIQAMEQRGQGVFIPASLDKGGKPKGKLVTPRQFALLRGVVERLVTRMAENLLAGNIEALPLLFDGEDEPKVCGYCDYRAVCGRESEEACRRFVKEKDEQLLQEMEEAADGTEAVDAAAAAEH